MKWSRFSEKADKTLMYELFPVAIIVVGNTAVVHYNTVVVSEDHAAKRERTMRGLIETLVLDGRNWKFLLLTSFQLGSDD